MLSTPSPPPSSCAAVKGPYAHFAHLKDALTISGGVTDQTALAGVYLFDNPQVDNRFIKNLTRVSHVKCRCQIVSEKNTAEAVPPTMEKSRYGYDLFLTFNQLLMAPAVRLEVHFVEHNLSEADPYHKIALEFSFNDRAGMQLHDFNCYVDSAGATHIIFNPSGASFEGATILEGIAGRFGRDEMKALKYLKSLTRTDYKEPVHFVLQSQYLSSDDQLELQKIIACLPGGSDHLLQSIGKPEYDNYPFERRGTMPLPQALMNRSPPNPMVPVDCPITFGSHAHFKTHQLGNASMSDWENQTSLQQFAMCRHKIALYGVKGIPVIAMKFGELPKNALMAAGGINLPNELEIKITFASPGRGYVEYTAVRDPYLQGVKEEHDAYFFITSHELEWFNGKHAADDDADPEYMEVSNLVPHPSSFLLRSLATAVDSLGMPRHSKILQFALGQSFNGPSLEKTDVISNLDVPVSSKDEAMRNLRDRKWNAEQCQVIDQLKCAKGGISLVTGTAGTGKTTVQMAIAVAFFQMGGRAACFATSNSNVITQADAICELAKAMQGLSIRVVRIVSTSKGIGFKYLTATQALAVRVGHTHGIVSTIWGLKFLRLDQRLGKMNAWKYTVEACMLEEADKGKLKLPFRYEENGTSFNAWKEFRKYLESSLSADFWKDEHEVKKYAQVFEFWAPAYALYQDHGVKKITCLCVLIDEIGKEQEISVWNAIVSAGLPRIPEFVMLLGDSKQLSPVNISVTKGLQCNPFAARGDMSMLDRLLALNWPRINLHRQQRMHPTLWAFPCSEFYPESVVHTASSAPGHLLEDVEPGLKTALDGIIATSYVGRVDGEQNRVDYLAYATDAQTRLHYLDFGVKPKVTKNYSVAIPGYIQGVFDLVIPALHKYFGERMNSDVMIVAAYGNAVNQYHGKVRELKELQNLGDEHYPRISTTNKSQGQEAKMVIVDNSMRCCDLLGFTKDRGQSNVAMTRAKEVMWVIGGPLSRSRSWAPAAPLDPFPELKRRMALQGQVHYFAI